MSRSSRGRAAGRPAVLRAARWAARPLGWPLWPLPVAAAIVGLCATLALPGAAQERAATDTTPPPAPHTGGWAAVDVAPRPGTPVVSVTLMFPHGSADDPEDRPGAAWLLGQVVRTMVYDGLDPSAREATELAVEVDRSRTTYRMVTLPSHWREAFGVLEWAVLRATPTDGAVGRAKADAREVSTFEENAPHREFELELYRLLAGLGSPWSRRPTGTPTTVQALDPAALASFRDRVFVRSAGVVVVVGGVDAASAARTVTDGPPLPGDGITSPDFVPGAGRETMPTVWEEGDRVELTREVTSTWIGVAWPFDRETPRTAQEMLVDRLDRRFNPSPPDPGAFTVDIRTEVMGSREILLVEAAVLPEAAGQWERRIRSAVDAIGEEEIEGPFFHAYRRRFRGARLLRDARPEVEGFRRARDLLMLGRVRILPSEISSLDAGDLARAAADLGEPRTFILGPDLSDGSRP